MHAAMTAITAKAMRKPKGLHLPRRAAISAGRPKMLAPTIVLNMSAARLQRPMVRTRPVLELVRSDCICFFAGRVVSSRNGVSLAQKAADAYRSATILRRTSHADERTFLP